MSDLSELQLETRWRHHREPMLLAFAGGAVDTISFVALFGLFTAHVTGNLVVAGAVVAQGGVDVVAKLLAVPVFMLAVAATALLVERAPRRDPQLLGRLLLLEALFLALFMLAGWHFAPFSGADSLHTIITGMTGVIAMGIRNGITRLLLATTSPSTMMTGNVTQLTIDLLAWSRNNTRIERARLVKSGSSVLGFTAGALVGALGYLGFGFGGLIIPLCVTLGLAIRELRTGAV